MNEIQLKAIRDNVTGNGVVEGRDLTILNLLNYVDQLRAQLPAPPVPVEAGQDFETWWDNPKDAVANIKDRYRECFKAGQSAAIPKEIEKDAKRYRWLRDKADFYLATGPQVIMTDEWGIPACGTKSIMPQTYLSSDKLDAAVDDAMLAAAKEQS